MGAEANGEETIDETQEVQEGQEEVPLNETAPEDVEDGSGDAETDDDTPPAADVTEARIKEETQATIRCVPFGYSQEDLGCDMVIGKPATCRVIMARSY